MTTIWVGALGAVLRADDADVLDLGPQHPSRAGAVRLDLSWSGDTVTVCRVTHGFEHRGVEKLFEVRDYRAALALADRHDWQAPAFGELSVVLSIEAALGILPPERATWLRTLAAEHARLHAQLGQLSWLEHRFDTAPAVAAAREGLRQTLAAWTGNRLHPMITRIGGVAFDVDAAWLDAEREAARRAREAADHLRELLDRLPGGVGTADADACAGWGLSGPFVRAAGVDRDLRRRQPALAYAELGVPAAVRDGGDARARLGCMLDDATIAAGLVVACCDRLAALAGPISTRLPKIIRLPEGTYYTPLEAPWGEAGVRIVSRGEKTPWRMSLRTPSLANVEALELLAPGTRRADLDLLVASIGYVAGDCDK